MTAARKELAALLTEVRACTVCRDLPLDPRPVVQGNLPPRAERARVWRAPLLATLAN